jgi:electron transfer flavoprotein alpha subunit
LAARFNSPIAADCTAVDLAGNTFTRPFFSGKAIAQIELSEAETRFVSIRPNSLSPTATTSSGSVTELAVDFDFGASALQFVSRSDAKSDRPDLTEANVIVSGGRSLKSSENFKLIFDCADAFGGAAGASRAAVDEGLVPHDMQVGQTGKTVNPSLYIACGISGAIQHLAGMRTSKVIVAINKDPNAPIFSKADYGIVGDLFEVVPLLTEEAKKLLGKAA